MAFLREGFTITYIGEDNAGLSLGDKGRLLAFASEEPNGVAHCLWETGSRSGQVTLTRIGDIDNASEKYQTPRDGLDDSLEVGLMHITGAQQVLATGGIDGVLVYLAAEGALGNLAHYTSDIVSMVANRIRSDVGIMNHLAALDIEEQEEIITQAAWHILNDTFGAA